MQAVQNIYHGGDGAILFQRSDVSAQSDFPDEQVNRLILDCSTSKDALSSLYNMVKNNDFRCNLKDIDFNSYLMTVSCNCSACSFI